MIGIGALLGIFKGKSLLMYIVLGIGIAITSATGTYKYLSYKYGKQLVETEQRYEKKINDQREQIFRDVEAANKQALELIEKEKKAAEEALVVALQTKQKLERQLRVKREKEKEVITNDQDAKKWADTVIPDAILNLLRERSETTTTNGSSENGSSETVPTTNTN